MADIIERLKDVQRMIGAMCSEGRCPKMSIPARPEHDEDLVICATIDEAVAEIQRARAENKSEDGYAAGWSAAIAAAATWIDRRGMEGTANALADDLCQPPECNERMHVKP